MKYLIISLFFISNFLFAGDFYNKASRQIPPSLQEVKILLENQKELYRLLLFRSGFERVSVKLFLQKYSIDMDNRENPYHLKINKALKEINNQYNLSIESARYSKGNFFIVFNATHIYTYQNHKITLIADKKLNYTMKIK